MNVVDVQFVIGALLGQGFAPTMNPSSYRGSVLALADAVQTRRVNYKATGANGVTDLNPWLGIEQQTGYTVSLLRNGSYKIPPAYPSSASPGPCPRCVLSATPITPPPGLNAMLGENVRNLEQLGALGSMGLPVPRISMVRTKAEGRDNDIPGHDLHNSRVCSQSTVRSFGRWLSRLPAVQPHSEWSFDRLR